MLIMACDAVLLFGSQSIWKNSATVAAQMTREGSDRLGTDGTVLQTDFAESNQNLPTCLMV